MMRHHLLIVVSLVFANFVLGAVAGSFLPPVTAVHWDLHGQANAWGPAWEIVFPVPVISLLTCALMCALPLIGSVGRSIERFSRIYGLMVVTLAIFMLCFQATILLLATGHAIPIERVMPALSGLVFMILGNWMGKTRRNKWVGIRTRWTLASDAVWERTHRVGGRLCVAYGLAIALAAAIGPIWSSLGVMFVGGLGLGGWALIYSRALYRQLEHGN